MKVRDKDNAPAIVSSPEVLPQAARSTAEKSIKRPVWLNPGVLEPQVKEARKRALLLAGFLRGFFTYRNTFIGFVIAPAIVAFFYLGFITADQYVAEGRFAVRTLHTDPGPEAKNAATAMASGSIPALASQDAYIIAAYIRSPAIIADLPPEIQLNDIYRRPEADFWSRLKAKATREELTDYWRSKVSAYVDGPSGMVTVDVRAFRADDALVLINAVIVNSEKLANSLSERARFDAMTRAELEVRRTEKLVRNALLDMRNYRDNEGFIDPGMQASSTLALLQQAMSENIQLHNEYFVAARAMSADSPVATNLQARISASDTQIIQLKKQLTSTAPENKTITSSLVRFEELELKRLFSEKLYMMAQTTLERARAKAEQQRIYISLFVPPTLPQESRFPERFSLSVQILLGLLIIWGIFALITATIEDHTF